MQNSKYLYSILIYTCRAYTINCAKINPMLTKTKNFNIIYDDMLKQFPKEELKQREHFLELFNNNYVLYEYSEEKDTNTKGYCIVFEGKEYILTDYLAIFKII